MQKAKYKPAASLIFVLPIVFGIGLSTLALTPEYLKANEPKNSALIKVDYAKLVSRADLHYLTPVSRSEEGMPVGNGTMGTFVWTTPASLKMQINRVDVFANDASSDNFYERHTDYCGGVGFVDFDFIREGESTFTDPFFDQHLSCYNGLVTVHGKGIIAEVFVWAGQDVMVVRIYPDENLPVTILAKLRSLRPIVINKGDHKAISRLDIKNNQLRLEQRFTEKNYYCGSSLSVGVSSNNATIEISNKEEIRFIVPPGKDPVTFFIATAASFDPNIELEAATTSLVEMALEQGFEKILQASSEWWENYWERSFVYLKSADGVADLIEQNYTYFLYVMGSSSRGKIPPKFNGMIWSTDGDARKWGNLFWGANQSCLYNGLFPVNRSELMDSYFNMYFEMYESCALAARQQWGSQGIYIPETVGFSGMPELPENIAREMRNLLLVQKKWEDRSEPYKKYAYTKMPFLSRWNQKTDLGWKDGLWQVGDKGGGAFGHVTHIFSRGAKIAYQFWMKYEYTNDLVWLKNRAYPMIKGVAEFYRNFPNFKKDTNGIYTISHVNDNESIWDASNTVEEISAMYGIFPVAIKASEILGVDQGLREQWKEILEHLSPLPMNTDLENAPHPEKKQWIKALPPVGRGNFVSHPDPNTMPVWFFDLCNLESKDQEMLDIANATFDSYFRDGINTASRVNVLSKLPVAGSILGRKESTRYLIPNQIHTAESEVFINRMTLREGFQTAGVQRLGRVADALHLALFQSAPEKPGENPVIRVFPAWPENWEASFSLLGRGNFLITSSIKNNSVEFVEIKSLSGLPCTLINPWKGKDVSLFIDGKENKTFSGPLVRFPTQKNGHYMLVKKGTVPDQFKIEITD